MMNPRFFAAIIFGALTLLVVFIAALFTGNGFAIKMALIAVVLSYVTQVLFYFGQNSRACENFSGILWAFTAIFAMSSILKILWIV